MGTRPRFRPLTPADLPHLVGARRSSADELWPRASMQQYGLCGLSVHAPVAGRSHVLVAPSLHLPPDHPRAGAGDRGTAVLMELVIGDGPRPAREARSLVHAVAARLPVRRIDALAAVTGRDDDPARPPAAWLTAAGFRPLSASPAATVWRLDLAPSLRWRQLRRAAGQQLQGWLQPSPVTAPPEPATRVPPRP